MIKRILFGLIAVTALATAVGVAVVAAAFALYALLKDQIGQPGAAAVVAAVAALIVAAAGLFAAVKARGPKKSAEPASLSDKLLDLARERPLIAAGAALAAGIVALKNPQAVAGLVSAFFAGKAADRAERRRR